MFQNNNLCIRKVKTNNGAVARIKIQLILNWLFYSIETASFLQLWYKGILISNGFGTDQFIHSRRRANLVAETECLELQNSSFVNPIFGLSFRLIETGLVL